MGLPNLTRLRYFVAVADTLNFRRASERLNIAQPAVSRAIRSLEKDIGFRLFERTTRTVRPTDAGAALADDARQALQILERSIRHSQQIAAGESGAVVIAYSVLAAHGPMPDLMVQFRQAYPSANVGLYQMASDEQQQAIELGQVDMGFMLSAACRIPLKHVCVHRERFVLLVWDQHPWSDRQSVFLQELSGHVFVIGAEERWKTFRALVVDVCRTAGFSPEFTEEAGDAPVLLELVAQQRGITLYGSSIAASLPPGVIAIPVCDHHATFDIGLVWDSGNGSPLVQKFIAFVGALAPEVKSGL